MKAQKLFVVVGALCVLLFAGLNSNEVHADTGSEWSSDAHVPGYLDDTFTPFLLTDRNRTVHAFASQWVSDGSRKAIVYRQWSLKGGWTKPIDIILSPARDANLLGTYLDVSDQIHVIFDAPMGPNNTAIYHSSAAADAADWVPAWSTPILMGEDSTSPSSAAIIGDGQGNLVVIYSGNKDGTGVYYVGSSDSGISWSKPVPVFLTYDTKLIPYSLRLALGPNRQIRAVWSVVSILGVDQALYFANYDLPSSDWSAPVELDRRANDSQGTFGPSFPTIVDNGKEIFIVYNGGNPFSGRYVPLGRPVKLVRTSSDGGLLWDGPLSPFPSHNGRSGEDAMVLDGNKLPHILFIQRIDTTSADGSYSSIGGIWHSVFQNGIWTTPDRFVTTYPPHDVRAVVSQGNVLLAVWREDPGVGENGIWYSYKVLDIPELPVVPLSTAPMPSLTQVAATDAPHFTTPTTMLDDNSIDNPPSANWEENPAFPIVLGLVPVLLVLVGVIAGSHFLKKHRD